MNCGPWPPPIPERLGPLLRPQGRVILAIDGLQPDVGHEVLWVLARLPLRRDPPGPEPLVVHRQGPGGADRPRCAGPCRCRSPAWSPMARRASAKRWPAALQGVPHQLCHFHYLREAAKPIYEADRHAKKELKKRVRGIRPIERAGGGGGGGRRGRRGGGGRAGLLRRGARRLDRRRAAAAGGLRAEAARPAEPDRRQPGPCGGRGGTACPGA